MKMKMNAVSIKRLLLQLLLMSLCTGMSHFGRTSYEVCAVHNFTYRVFNWFRYFPPRVTHQLSIFADTVSELDGQTSGEENLSYWLVFSKAWCMFVIP